MVFYLPELPYELVYNRLRELLSAQLHLVYSVMATLARSIPPFEKAFIDEPVEEEDHARPVDRVALSAVFGFLVDPIPAWNARDHFPPRPQATDGSGDRRAGYQEALT